MKCQSFIISASIPLTALTCLIQQKADGQELEKNYRVFNRILTAGKSSGAVHLNEAMGAGIAWITGQEFSYGVIELDVRGKDAFQQSFVGLAFHGLNDTTYEAIYFRPFNFHSTDPVRKAHAVQYIANPLYDWPKLRADFPNKYEQPLSPPPDPNDWFHVRITVETKKISVFVNANNNPALVVEPLVPLNGKQIGYWVGNGSAGDWKNLTMQPAIR
ncbi:MAG TPA: hypothetical protein VGZ71_15245 [Puia sp.]|jgi:hypothetical protein|nr:hypothetical protein [Puia sp.]